MSLHFSILINVTGDDSIADLPSNLSEAIVTGASLVHGVTSVSVEQLMPGDELLPPTEP